MGVDVLDPIPGDVFGVVAVDMGELVRVGSAISLFRVGVWVAPGGPKGVGLCIVCPREEDVVS